eukprot:1148478-Pelagomonas_calceolata.AAC.2
MILTRTRAGVTQTTSPIPLDVLALHVTTLQRVKSGFEALAALQLSSTCAYAHAPPCNLFRSCPHKLLFSFCPCAGSGVSLFVSIELQAGQGKSPGK